MKRKPAKRKARVKMWAIYTPQARQPFRHICSSRAEAYARRPLYGAWLKIVRVEVREL